MICCNDNDRLGLLPFIEISFGLVLLIATPKASWMWVGRDMIARQREETILMIEQQQQ